MQSVADLHALPADALTLGIDLGTSAVKVLALDGLGQALAAGSADFPTISQEPGQAEQEPAAWLAALERAMAALDRELSPRSPAWLAQVVGIGLTGQLPTLVCLGDQGPLGPAITWKDARADAWAALQIDAPTRRSLYARTGMPIDGRYLGPMLLHHFAGRLAQVRTVLSAKDYLCYALTGMRVTDPSTAAGYGAYDLVRGDFAPDLCAQWQLPAAALPALRPAHAPAGGLSEGGARLLGLAPGIPVSVGAADSVAGAYALAGLEEGIICISMGSSTIILDAIRAARPDTQDRYLLTPHVVPGWYGREMDLLATGTGHRWLSELFGWSEGRLDQLAAQSPAGARGLRFAPYLAGGEQGALWDPSLRGALHGLTLQHSHADIARAFLEGVYFEIRRCVDVLAETAPVRGVVISGGIVDFPESLQLLADILEQPVRAVRSASAAAQGAALGAREMLQGAAASIPAGTRGAESGAIPLQAHAGAPTLPGVNSPGYRALYADYRQTIA